MTTMDLLKEKRAELLHAAAAHRAMNLRIFGSVARGEDRGESDIDFLVDFDPSASLIDLIGLKEDIERIVGRQADVVTESAVSPFLRERILRERILREARPL
jgi:predicted nucleotidyltransferase